VSVSLRVCLSFCNAAWAVATTLVGHPAHNIGVGDGVLAIAAAAVVTTAIAAAAVVTTAEAAASAADGG